MFWILHGNDSYYFTRKLFTPFIPIDKNDGDLKALSLKLLSLITYKWRIIRTCTISNKIMCNHFVKERIRFQEEWYKLYHLLPIWLMLVIKEYGRGMLTK